MRSEDRFNVSVWDLEPTRYGGFGKNWGGLAVVNCWESKADRMRPGEDSRGA